MISGRKEPSAVFSPTKPNLRTLTCLGLAALLAGVGSGSAQLPGSVRWSVETGVSVLSSPALGADGTIFVGVGSSVEQTYAGPSLLYAISPQGQTNWVRTLGPPGAGGVSPAIGADGTVYFGSGSKLFALNPNSGTTNWTFTTGGKFMSSPALASDGTIYIYALIGTSNKLFSVRAGGGTNWIFTMAGLVVSGPASVQFPSPAIGPDGTIYAGTLGGQLYAVSPAGRTNWVITLGNETYSSPAVGPDGTIYLGCDDGKVYAVDWRGFPKWTYDTGGFVECSASVSSGGAIFIGSLSGTFYQFTAQGVPQWLVNNGFVSASPALASDGSIYFASSSALYAYSSAHALLWSFSGSGLFFSSPTIGADGTVYVGSGTKLYALYGTNTLQNSSWAMFRREVTHQARSIQRGIRPPALAPDGTAALTLTVETGRTYAVEASTNLLNWTALTNFVSASLTNVVVDATAGNFRARFYRLRTP